LGFKKVYEVIMEISGLFIAGLACIIIVITSKWWDLKQENESLNSYIVQQSSNEKKEVMKETNTEQNNNIGTRDLFLNVLTQIGCQYELGEGDDNRIFFAYQGERFFAESSNESLWVNIWDTYWEHVELYDIDEMARMKKAINTSNLNTMVSTVYTIDQDGKNMDIHAKNTFPFFSKIPNIDQFLRAELNDFFRAHQYVNNEVMKLRQEEQKV
jgi:hypothetical protein